MVFHFNWHVKYIGKYCVETVLGMSIECINVRLLF